MRIVKITRNTSKVRYGTKTMRHGAAYMRCTWIGPVFVLTANTEARNNMAERNFKN